MFAKPGTGTVSYYDLEYYYIAYLKPYSAKVEDRDQKRVSLDLFSTAIFISVAIERQGRGGKRNADIFGNDDLGTDLMVPKKRALQSSVFQ